MESILGILLLLIPIAYYAIYGAAVGNIAKRRSPGSPLNAKNTPFVSIVIPTYNEMKVIEKRIKNLDSLEYAGQLETIFVDGASTDGTAEFIDRMSEGRSSIRILRQRSRQGYNSAIYEGICESRSNIIVTSEAGAFFHPKAISSVVRHLNEPSIGVATGKSVLQNPDESLATRLEDAYRSAHDKIRYAESNVDSTPDMKGELLAFRKEIGLKLIPRETLPDNASFDMSVSYMARSLGLRAVFDPEAIFYEYAPASLKERMIVQIRRGTTFTGALWNFRSMILDHKFGYFGVLIAPSRFLMLLVFPWMLLTAPIILCWESLFQPLLGIAILAVAGIALIYRKTRYILISFVLSQVVLAIAAVRLLLRRQTQIDTAPTTRR